MDTVSPIEAEGGVQGRFGGVEGFEDQSDPGRPCRKARHKMVTKINGHMVCCFPSFPRFFSDGSLARTAEFIGRLDLVVDQNLGSRF